MEGNFGVFRLVLFEKFAQNYPSVKRILRGTFLYNYKINAQFSIKKHGSLTYRTNLVLYFISQKKFMEKLKMYRLQEMNTKSPFLKPKVEVKVEKPKVDSFADEKAIHELLKQSR